MFANMMMCGCCTGVSHPPPCGPYDFKLEDCSGAGLPGGVVTISTGLHATGTILDSGTTGSDGLWHTSITACSFYVRYEYGGLTYDAPAGAVARDPTTGTFRAMYASSTYTATVEDYDTGAPILGPYTHAAIYLGDPFRDPDGLVSIESIDFGGGGGYTWSGSTSAAILLFTGRPDYLGICGIDRTVHCGDALTRVYKACSVANWNLSPWFVCGTDASGTRVGAIPRTLHATFSAPTGILGTDAGVPIALNWVSTSWNGSDYAPPAGRVMAYSSGCRGGNGNGYATTDATFVIAYDSSSGGYSAGAGYDNWDDAGCVNGHPAPGTPVRYCPTVLGPTTYYQFYPQAIPDPSATIVVTDLNTGSTRVQVSAPVNTSEAGMWHSSCHNPYDPTTGETASAIITE